MASHEKGFHQPLSNWEFRMMAFGFFLRDLVWPPARILRRVGIRSGMTVLDFGCGPGGFSLAAARLVGAEGRVYSVDHHPLAVKSVRRGASRRGLENILIISGSSLSGVPDTTVDVVLLYDALHEVPGSAPILGEFFRVLKPDGVLSVRDLHLCKKAILNRVTGGGIFRLACQDWRTYRFEPIRACEKTA